MKETHKNVLRSLTREELQDYIRFLGPHIFNRSYKHCRVKTKSYQKLMSLGLITKHPKGFHTVSDDRLTKPELVESLFELLLERTVFSENNNNNYIELLQTAGMV